MKSFPPGRTHRLLFGLGQKGIGENLANLRFQTLPNFPVEAVFDISIAMILLRSNRPSVLMRLVGVNGAR